MTYRCVRCSFASDDDEQIAEHTWRGPKHPRCIVCGKSLPAEADQTCLACVGKTRADLANIQDAFVRLPAVVENSGWRQLNINALTYEADGSVEGGGPDDWPSDPTPVIAVLESCERDWRHSFGQSPAEDVATVAGCFAYLTRHLDRAAQQLPQFDDFADEIRQLRSRLTSTVGTVSRPEKARGVECFDCGLPLICDYRPPQRAAQARIDEGNRLLAEARRRRRLEQRVVEIRNDRLPRDEDGKLSPGYELEPIPPGLTIIEQRQIVATVALGHAREGLDVAPVKRDDDDPAGDDVERVWHCPRCKRVYDGPSVRLAQKAAIEGADGMVLVAVAHQLTGKSERWIRHWAATGRVDSIRDENGFTRVSKLQCLALARKPQKRVG